MNWFSNLKVKQKLYFLIAVFSIAIIGIGVLGHVNLKKSSQSMETLYAVNVKAIELTGDCRLAQRRIQADLFALMVTTEDTENKRLSADIIQTRTRFDDNIVQYEQLPLTQQQKAELEVVKTIVAQYRAANADVVALAVQNKNEEAYKLFQVKAAPLGDQLFDKLIAISNGANQSSEQMTQIAQDDVTSSSMTSIAITVIALLVGVTVGGLIIKQITMRLSDSVKFLGDIASGDFSRDVAEHSMKDQSEFGALSQSVDRMNRNIRALIKQLLNTSEQLAAASQELTASAEQSAHATKDITELIVDVQAKTKTAVDFMNESKREVKMGSELVDLAGKNFNEILTMIKVVADEINEISAATEELTSGTEDVVTAANSISGETKKTAEATQSVSAATEEQSASMQEIASASTHLLKMAADLQNEIQKFKI